MKRALYSLFTIMVMVGLFFGGLAVSEAKPVKFKAVAFLPVNNANVAGFNIFIKKVNEKFKDNIESGQVQIHKDKSQFVYDQFPDQYFDWIYVDGSHNYKSVRRDLDFYYPKVKMYGFITGDDYRFAEKRRGLRDAVAEISEKYLMRLILIKNNQFILWKKKPGMPPEGPLPPPQVV